MTEAAKVRTIAFLGDHQSRKCGSATFTTDLCRRIVKAHR